MTGARGSMTAHAIALANIALANIALANITLATITLATITLACGAACDAPDTGRLCQPDADNCAEGSQCLTFCNVGDDGDVRSVSICAPANAGPPASDTFENEAVIDGRSAFGEFSRYRHLQRSLGVTLSGIDGLALPILEDVEGDLTVSATSLKCLSLPRLVRVGGALIIDGNEALAAIDLTSLTSVGSFEVVDNPELTVLALDNLRSTTTAATRSLVEDNERLTEVDLSRVTDIAGSVCVRTGDVTQRDGPPIVSIDRLASGCMDIEALDAESACYASDGGAQCPLDARVDDAIIACRGCADDCAPISEVLRCP